MSVQLASADINKLLDSRDPDACLSYLSLVNGIDGALLYNQEGLVMAAGEDSSVSLRIEGPYLLFHFREALKHLEKLGMETLESQIAFGGDKFHLVLNMDKSDRFFLVVSGTRGSYDLFKYRVDRVASALETLLRDRGYFRVPKV